MLGGHLELATGDPEQCLAVDDKPRPPLQTLPASITRSWLARSRRLRAVRGTGVDHFDLVVSDLERSLALYRALLEPLGYVRASEIVGERGEPVVYLGGPQVISVSLRQAQTPGPYDRYRIGIHHVAFQAPSREVVDERLRWVRERGLEVEDEPTEYDYRPGYYAGFFYDPDGIKLEIVHAP